VTGRLTDADRSVIAEARRIGPGLRAMDSELDRLAGWLLKELADLAERLGGGEDQGDGAGGTQRLEAIERIAEGGQA
jgi:hypothetical protein